MGNAIYDLAEPRAPMVLPGRYQVRLNVAGKSYSAPFEVRMDPRIATARDDLDKQLELMRKMWHVLGRSHSAVLQMRSLRGQLEALRKRTPENAAIAAAAKAIDDKMSSLEAELIEVKARSSQDLVNYPTKLNNKLTWLINVVDSADTAPTQQSYDFFEELKTRVDTLLAHWREIVTKDVPMLNELVRKEGVLMVGVESASSGSFDDESRRDSKSPAPVTIHYLAKRRGGAGQAEPEAARGRPFSASTPSGGIGSVGCRRSSGVLGKGA